MSDLSEASGARAEPSPSLAAGRPRRGQRRTQILQALAALLEQPGTERITTAALAARLALSEAALYRHFSSKAQMLEGLIEFVEVSVLAPLEPPEPPAFGRPPGGRELAQQAVVGLLQFAERHPGMARLMAGDALAFEDERLGARMNRFFERLEALLRQSLRQAAQAEGSPSPTQDAQVQASVLCAFAVGRLQRFARSGFRQSPTEHLDAALVLLLR